MAVSSMKSSMSVDSMQVSELLADLAVKDINAAGGVLGRNVVLEVRDSGDARSAIAPASVDSLIGNGADVIIGSMSSAVTFLVIDKVTAKGRLMVSPGNTSTRLRPSRSSTE